MAQPTGITEAPIPAYAYQWYRNGVAITGATHVTYTPVALDYGKTISVRVIASKLDYTSQLVTTTR